MTAILGILTFIVILAVLILVHELGHFTMAKLFGVRVDEFGLGFPPRIACWRRGETVYSINAIPIGGFVKMEGENGEADDPRSFGAKPQWQRLVILASGPGMNILLAVVVLAIVFMTGWPRPITTITAVSKGSPAAAAGLRAGDTIVALDGTHVTYYDQLAPAARAHRGQRVPIVVRRGGRLIRTRVLIRAHPPQHQGAMGVVLGGTAMERYGPVKSVQMALSAVGTGIATIPMALASMVAGPGRSQVEGPIGIAHNTVDAVQSGPKSLWASILLLAATISANLGVANLLPIPALDGGRIVFVLISWIRRRNIDPQIEGLIHLTGMAVLLFLILLISYQDVSRWISGAS